MIAAYLQFIDKVLIIEFYVSLVILNVGIEVGTECFSVYVLRD